MGIIYALACSVLPNCQNPMLPAKNMIPKRMKNADEKTSALAQSMAAFNASILVVFLG